jgi:hypothetical protein
MAAMKGDGRMAAFSVRYLGRMLRAVADRLDPDGAQVVDELQIVSDGPAVIFRLDGHPYAAVIAEQLAHG